MKQLYLYGEVGLDFTAASLAKELKGDVQVNINSSGGDLFEGLTIYNLLKKHSGRVEVVIDGLCASAASLIACAGDSVKMAANSLFMIHNPAAVLSGAFESSELDKMQNLLGALKDSILTTYENKTKKPREELEKMVDAETWLGAAEAKALGFVDEITGAVEATYNAARKALIINKMPVTGRSIDFEKMAAAVGAVAQEEEKMAEQIDVAALRAEAAQAERARIMNLTALKCDNAAVNAIVDLAVSDGKELSEVQRYIDAVKIAQPLTKPAVSAENSAVERICAMIRDNLKSGAEGVEGAAPVKDEKVAQAEMLARFTNEALKRGGVR